MLYPGNLNRQVSRGAQTTNNQLMNKSSLTLGDQKPPQLFHKHNQFRLGISTNSLNRNATYKSKTPKTVHLWVLPIQIITYQKYQFHTTIQPVSTHQTATANLASLWLNSRTMKWILLLMPTSNLKYLNLKWIKQDHLINNLTKTPLITKVTSHLLLIPHARIQVEPELIQGIGGIVKHLTIQLEL